MSTATNRAVAEWLIREVWNQGDTSGIERHVAPEILGHFRGLTQQESPDSLRRMVSSWRTAFPDLSHQVAAPLTDGDLVALSMPFTGAHTGVFRFGALVVQPTGKRVNVTEMLLLRFADGKIAEVWTEFDLLGLLQQLGVVGTTAQPPAARRCVASRAATP